jgi:hypothetical protein
MHGEEADLMFESFRRRAGLSPIALWLRYFALGGNASPEQVAEFLAGTSRPERGDHNLLAQALNERFMDLGRHERIAYRESAPSRDT